MGSVAEQRKARPGAASRVVGTLRGLVTLPARRKWVLGIIGVVALGLVIGGALTLTSDDVPRGQWFYGDSMAINFQDFQRLPEVRYAEGEDHWVVRPQSEDNELIAVRLDVRNRASAETLFTVDEKALRLRDRDYLEYYPVNPLEQREPAPGPSPLEGRNVPFIWGPVSLPHEWKVEGWVLFEVPRGTAVSQIVWETGDTIYIHFKR